MGIKMKNQCDQKITLLAIGVFVILAFTLNGINAAPAASQAPVCRDGCPSSNKGSKLNYYAGQVYVYDLESTITVSLAGGDAQDTTLQVQGQAQLYGLSNDCQYGLRLQNVILFGPDKKKNKLSDSLQLAKLVRFTLANDKIEPEICAETSETAFSLNLKRAVISLFQSVEGSSHETDIFGTCPTAFSTSKSADGSQVVTKTRDLTICGQREVLANGFVTGIVNERSGVKATPLLNGDYTVEQRINRNGVIESVQSTEEYTFVPYSSGETGAKARVVTKLQKKDQRQSEAPKLPAPAVTRPRSIIFHNPASTKLTNVNVVKSTLRNTIETYKNNVGAKAATQFTELIRLLRYTPKDDLLTLYSQTNAGTIHKNNELAKKIYLDALFRTGTSESVEVVATLLKSNKIDDVKALAYLSFNLASTVNKDALLAVQKLLDAVLPKEAYLSIGHLINKYCQKNPCEGNEIKTILDKFISKLGNCKSDTRQHEDHVISILKGLRNSNNVAGAALDRIVACSNDKHSTRVRVASIQAFTAAACNKKIQTTALNLLKNRDEDAELRIEAYLALVACPNAQVASAIKTLLDDEPVYQVGSFITTHLANLRASTDPSREQARAHLVNIQSAKKFPTDFRQYSFNHELSYAIDSLGVGASLDSNVIYSPKSILPRSVRSNITGQVFGTNFNILELQGRQENLDLLLEHYFGPKGTLNTLNKQELVTKVLRALGVGENRRERRGLREDVQQFNNQINLGNEVNQDIDLDLSLKMFGSELYFLSLADNLPLDCKDFLKVAENWFNKFVKKTKDGFTYDFQSHSLFLDAELVYPTGIGFPLKLQAQGAAVVRLETEAQADLKQIVQDPKNTRFVVKIVPSYNLELSGTLSVDGWAVSTGLQVSGSVHSSTGAKLSFALLDNAKGLDINLDLPLKKQEIFGFDHKIVFITQERGHETVATNLKFSSKKKELNNMCFDQFNRYVGATFCVDVSLTVPGSSGTGVAVFPLNGPNHASVWIEVDNSYNFKALYNDKEQNYRSLEFIFDTPGAVHNRRTSLLLEASSAPKIFTRVKLDSPYRNITGELGLTNDNTEVSVYVQTVNGPDVYLGKVGFKISGSSPRQEYTPIVSYSAPGKQGNNLLGYSVNGKVIVDTSRPPKTRFEFQNLEVHQSEKVSNVKVGPIRIVGWLEHEQFTNFATDVTVSQAEKSGTLRGYLNAKEKGVDLDLSFVNNFNEYANGKVRFDFLNSENQYKNNLVVVFGKDVNSPINRLEILQEYQYEKNGEQVTRFSGKNELNAPFVPIKLKCNGDISDNLVSYDVGAEYAKHRLNNNFHLKRNLKNVGDWDLLFDLGVNAHKLNFVSTQDINVNEQKANLRNKLTTSLGTDIQVNSVYSQKLSRQEADINVEGQVLLAEREEIYKFNGLVLLTPKSGDLSGKLFVGATQLATYNVKLVRNGGDPNNPTSGDVQLNIKDILDARGTYKSLKRVGESSLLVVLQRGGRKLKLTTNFNCPESQVDIRNELYYDFEKDNSKRIVFDTKNKYSKTNINSRNQLEISKETYELNFQGDSAKKGKVNGNFLFRLPSNRQITGEIDRDVNVQSGRGNGQVKLKLVDTLAPSAGRKSRSLSYDAVLNDADLKARLFHIKHHIQYVDFDGKDVTVDTDLKHLPSGEFKTASAALTVKGALIPNAVDLLIDNEYCPVHATYRVTAKYGGQFNFNVNGNYQLGERGVKPATYEISVAAALPQTQLKEVKLESSASLSQPLVNTPNGQYELKFKLLGKLNENELQFDTQGKAGERQGTVTVNLSLPETAPFSVDASYGYDDVQGRTQNAVHHAEGTVQVRYGNGKQVKFTGDARVTENQEAVLHATLQTPYEKAKNLDILVKSNVQKEKTYNTEAVLTVDDKQYKSVSAVTLSDANPSVDVHVYYPPNKHVQFTSAVTRLSDHKFKGSVKLLNLNDFNFVAEGDVDYQNAENFGVRLNVDSPKLNVNNVHIEAQSKQGSSGKGVEFKALAENKNILSGYADYTVKEEKGKTVIEGQGNVKLYDQPKAASFKFIKNNFEEARDNETGALLVFNGLLGTKNIVAEVKVTDKNLHFRHTICEEKTPCINLEVKSVLRHVDLENFSHGLLVSIDLRKLGFEHEFKLKAETERNGFELNHNLDMHLQSLEKTKYQYSVYVQPTKSGVVLTIPTRTVSIEAVYQVPREVFGRYDASISTYLDKQNRPDRRATIGFSGEVRRVSNSVITADGTLKLSHPAIKELKVVGHTEVNGEQQALVGTLLLDLFKTTNQAILVSAKYGNTDRSDKGYNLGAELSLTSKGLGLQYGFVGHALANLETRQASASVEVTAPSPDVKLSAYASASEEKFEAGVKAFNQELAHASAQFDLSRQNALLEASARLLGTDPFFSSLKIVELASVTASAGHGQLLQINGEFTIGKEASVKVIGTGKELFKTRVALDQTNFLSSEYNVNDKDFKEFLKAAQNELKLDSEKSRTEVSRRFNEIQQTLSNQLNAFNSNLPDFSRINAEYKQELQQIGDELLADKSVREFVDFFKNIYAVVGEPIVEILNILGEHINKTYEILKNFFSHLSDAFNKKILPALKDTLEKVIQITSELFENAFNFILSVLEKSVEGLKVFEEDFKKIGQIVSQALKRVAEVVVKLADSLRKGLQDLYKAISETIKKLPGIEVLREKFDEVLGGLSVPDHIVNILHEITDTLKESLPTVELAQFVDTLTEYIEKKLRKQDVVDVESIKAIYVSLVKAIKSVLELVRGPITDVKDGLYPSSLWSPIPLSLQALKRLPSLSTLKLSALNYLRNERIVSLRDLVYTYRPSEFNPLNSIPPFPKHGRIIEGVHLFTFDGQHLTLPGACQYVLAEDVVNKNFSVVANIGDGKLKSIAILDKSGDSIEVNDRGQVTVNGKPSELPAHENNVYAWRSYYSLNLLSSYGVRITCKVDLRICHLAVNGYYHGKLRGLLGNGNNEPYDDWQLPNGKVGQSLSEFGNSYKLQKSCPAISVNEQHEHEKDDGQSVECSNAFSWESPLHNCYYFIDPQPYREACSHAVATAANKQEAACNIALGYASHCRLENIPINVPSNCQKCRVLEVDGQEKEYTVGEHYQATAPQKRADVVFVIDTSVPQDSLTELVQSLITELRKQLKTRDVSDVQVNVIGYKKGEKYFSHYTSNGQLDITGKFQLPKRKSDNELIEDQAIKTGDAKIDQIIEQNYQSLVKLQEDLSLSADGRAFREALSYPFRSTASKAIIAIRSDTLTHSPNPVKLLGATLAGSLAEALGIEVHLIAPTTELKLGGGKNPSTVVGFNSKTVLQLSDFKKHTNVGLTGLRHQLEYGSDLGIDLVQKSENGYAFSLTNYNNLKTPREKKNFLSVVSVALAEQIANTEVNSECTCTLYKGLFAREACFAKESKVLPTVRKQRV